jgi:hypothetical protein
VIARVAGFEGVDLAEAGRTTDEAEAVIRPRVVPVDRVRVPVDERR